MKKTINRILLSILMLLFVASLFSNGIMKNYEPGETYFCKLGYTIIFELPLGDRYSLEYEKSDDFTVENLDSFVVVYPNAKDKRLGIRISNSENRFIEAVVESKPRDYSEKSVLKVIVEKFPENSKPDLLTSSLTIEPENGIIPKKNQQKFLEVQKPFYKKVFGRRRQKTPPGRRRHENKHWVFDNAISLQGGLIHGSSHFNLDGELVLNVKSFKGLLIQAASKVIYNDYIQKYGISIGGGYEPGNIGLFVFVDGISYRFNDFDTTLHFQVRPTLRIRTKRISATLFYAAGFGDQYTGVDAVELSPDGEKIGIYNKALSHFGVSLKTFLFNRLYVRLKSLAAPGKVFQVDCETGFELFPNLYVTGQYNTANFGKYPELAMDGYANQNSFGIGIRYLFGNRKKPKYDLRTRNIVETDYPVVVSYKKVKEKKEEKKEEKEEEPDNLGVTLTGTPLSGKAPLSVDFTALPKGGQAPYKYRWYFEGQENDPTHGKENEKHTYYREGSYRVFVEVEDNTGSKATSDKLSIDVRDSGKYKIVAKAHEGAKIKPEGTILAEPGGSYKFEMSVLDGYKIDRVEVDGKKIGAVVEYTFKDVKNDHRIEVWAKKDDGVKQYKIISISSSGGHNDPEGTILVDEGTSLKINILPDTGKNIQDVKVDGKSAGPVSEYTFSDIDADHTIESFFETGVFFIEAIQNTGGSISPAGITEVQKGGSQTYQITVNAGHELTGLLVDGQSVGVPSGNTYLFNNVNANHTIEPLFGQQTFTINATSEGSGSIVESGAVQVVYGSDKTFVFTADEGWEASELKIDGTIVTLPGNNQYTFNNVTSDHTIHITFTRKKYQITVISNDGGSVSPGTTEVEYGDDISFQINPLVSHNISDVKIDGGSLGPQNAYTFNNVTANHTLEAVFVIKTFDITVITNEGTTCTPGSMTVTYGSDQTFGFGTTSEGRYISDAKIDNVSRGEKAKWTFTNITTNHKIELFSEWYYYDISETHQISGYVTLNGQTNPGTIKVRWGDSCQCAFAVNSNSGKEIENVTIDGASKGVINTFKFENVKEDHAVHLDTQWVYYTIDVNWTGSGQISPGATQVRHGESQTFRIIPDPGYQIDNLKIDNKGVTITDIYTFSNVTANHSIFAEFGKIPLPKFDVSYGGYTFDWVDSTLSPSFGSGGGGPVITEKIEQGQVFEYTYNEFVKDSGLAVRDQFEIPFQYVVINGVHHYNRHISITITRDTTITAYYYIDRDLQ